MASSPTNAIEAEQEGGALVPMGYGRNDRVVVCGLPSSLTYFAADLARDLMSRAHGGCEVVSCNTLSMETREQLAGVDGPLIAFADVPDASVVAMVQTGTLPLLVIDQGFSEACKDLMAARDLSLRDAARSMSRAQMGIAALASVPRAEIVRPDWLLPTTLLAESIAQALHLPKSVTENAVAERGLDRPLSALIELQFEHGPSFDDDIASSVLARLGQFYGLSMPCTSAPWEVPLEVLVEGKPPHLAATESIDLVGPTRCLTFGPYLNLPTGRWAAKFEFSAQENIPANTFGFDLLADQEIKVDRQFEVEGSGSYCFTFEFDVSDPFHPFEFRTFVRRGAISGRFKALSLSLWPVEPAA